MDTGTKLYIVRLKYNSGSVIGRSLLDLFGLAASDENAQLLAEDFCKNRDATLVYVKPAVIFDERDCDDKERARLKLKVPANFGSAKPVKDQDQNQGKDKDKDAKK